MKDEFFALAGRLFAELRAGEVLLANVSAERSDFVRFNRGRVRQAGSVAQRYLSLRLVHAKRHASASLALAGNGEDFGAARGMLLRLRELLPALPEDPWLSIAEDPRSTMSERRGRLPTAETVVDATLGAARGLDLVGFYAGGEILRGFANSLGQTNWHAVESFNFDWSLHGEDRRAAKTSYAGSQWDDAAFAARVDAAAKDLAVLALPPRRIEPGEYRVFLAPRAMEELVGLLCWGGFSARSRATKQSPLLRMELGESLSEQVSLVENTAEGTAPGFQAEGFVKPARVTLVERGKLADALVSPRSAREFGLATNAANAGETPESLELAPGALEARDVLAALDTGLYISDLWYLNYSDRAAGRVTGMTRFACFRVERGRIAAPLEPMRFDDSVYRMLGENLVDLTQRREWLPDSGTYGERSTASARLPGALLGALRFTL
jgi:predicted Zn-dependent protease